MSALTQITTCMLCQQRFTHPPAKMIDENVPDADTIKLVQGLAKHFEKAHKKQYTGYALAGQEYTGLLLVMNMQTADPVLNDLRENVRHKIHGFTTARRINDQSIAAQVESLNIPALIEAGADPADIVKLIVRKVTEMRDILEESGDFAPKPGQAPDAPMVIPMPAGSLPH